VPPNFPGAVSIQHEGAFIMDVIRLVRFSLLTMILTTFLGSLSFPRTLWALEGVLENPRPNSSQSGIGLVSGWKCAAGRIDVVFDDDPPEPAAYGTAREDTASICGDTNNGFGLLVNWNRLGDGSHTVRALADGVEFGRSTVTVVTLGEEFLTGAHEDFTLKDFPVSGQEIKLQWQESMQNFVISKSTAKQSQAVLPLMVSNTSAASAPKGFLENPQDKFFASGISVISGWVCNANRVDIEIDGATIFKAGYGTDRPDTADACKNDGNNGFGLLFNWDRLFGGQHTIRALADGVEFGRATFTINTLGKEFFAGLSKTIIVENFPEGGTNVTLQWEEALQNFTIKDASGATCGGSAPCSCGDTVQQSTTLATDLGVCPGVGLKVASGVVLDCAGHTITGSNQAGAWYGIFLDDANGAEVRNCRVTNFRRGLRISGGQANRLINNESFVNRYGIDLAGATTNNFIQGNLIHDSRDEGIHIGTGANNNELRGNTFRKNKHENIYLLHADGNTIVENTSTEADNTAIFLKHSSNNNVSDNTTDTTPIQLRGDSTGNTLNNNHLTGNGYFFEGYEDPPGVWTYPHDNQVTGGSVNGAYACLRFSGAYNNRIDQLQISNCGIPVLLESLGGQEPTGNIINTIPAQ
jgi:parallel beta-helix repeat protein